MLLYYDPLFLQHDTGDHPENAGRIVPAARHLNLVAMHFGCIRPSWEPLSMEGLAGVHDPSYVDSIRRLSEGGGGVLDHDTVLSTRSFDVSRTAAGAVCDAVDKVIAGGEQHAFCLFGHRVIMPRNREWIRLFNNVCWYAEGSTNIDRADR
jgi:acetoin utilization deacetylase AcuC-like enzyme